MMQTIEYSSHQKIDYFHFGILTGSIHWKLKNDLLKYKYVLMICNVLIQLIRAQPYIDVIKSFVI